MSARMAKKTILITGCSAGGIGDSLAREFHSKGLRVFATARSPSKMAHLAELGIETLILDVTSTKSIADATASVAAETGGTLDYLLNNSGGGYAMPITDVNVEAAKQMFDVNFWALITVTQAFMPLLIKAHGTVINNTSIVAHLPLPFSGPYCASKAAASSLTSNMRLEFKPLGVKVIDIKTGLVNTHFFDNLNKEHVRGIPDDSRYLAAKKEVEMAMIGDTVDEKQMMKVGVYAKKVVHDVLGKSPPAVVWRGASASMVWFMSSYPGVGLTDFIGGKLTGLSGVAKKMRS